MLDLIIMMIGLKPVKTSILTVWWCSMIILLCSCVFKCLYKYSFFLLFGTFMYLFIITIIITTVWCYHYHQWMMTITTATNRHELPLLLLPSKEKYVKEGTTHQYIFMDIHGDLFIRKLNICICYTNANCRDMEHSHLLEPMAWTWLDPYVAMLHWTPGPNISYIIYWYETIFIHTHIYIYYILCIILFIYALFRPQSFQIQSFLLQCNLTWPGTVTSRKASACWRRRQPSRGGAVAFQKGAGDQTGGSPQLPSCKTYKKLGKTTIFNR
jgi:hypothetical protein